MSSGSPGCFLKSPWSGTDVGLVRECSGCVKSRARGVCVSSKDQVIRSQWPWECYRRSRCHLWQLQPCQITPKVANSPKRKRFGLYTYQQHYKRLQYIKCEARSPNLRWVWGLRVVNMISTNMISTSDDQVHIWECLVQSVIYYD